MSSALLLGISYLVVRRWNTGPRIDWTSHIVVMKNRLFHLSHLTKYNFLILSSTRLQRIDTVFFVIFCFEITDLIVSDAIQFFGVDVIFQHIFLDAVDCEWFFEVVSTKSWGRPMVDMTLFSIQIAVFGIQPRFFGVDRVLFWVLFGWKSIFHAQISAFVETLNSFPSGRSIIFLFDFLYSWVGFCYLEFGVTVEGRLVVGFADVVWILGCNVGKTVVFHVKN